MNRNLKLPVDFRIKNVTEESVAISAHGLGLKQYYDGYSPVGDVRIGLIPFLLKNEDGFVRSDEIENYVDERNVVGSSAWKYFVHDMAKVPESWDYNLYFSTFFNPINPKDPKTKFIFCLTKGTGSVLKPILKPVLTLFVPKENDMLVCCL